MKDATENGESVFDRVLHSVGDDGKFQRRYNVVFNFCLSAVVTLVYMNIIMALTIPDHWCRVPGRENANKTIQEWKNITLPRRIDSSGVESYSSCTMLNFTQDSGNGDDNSITCQHGYEYDTEWYTSTIPSSQDWVCDKELHVSHIFAAAKVGEVIGGLVLGYLGDIIGRRLVFMIAIGVSIVCRLTSILMAEHFVVFLILSVLATMPGVIGGQACQVILMEISPMEDRAAIAQYQLVGWTFGLCSLPLIYWFFRDWTLYMIFSTVPLMLYIPLAFFLIESPRWLMSRGRIADCIKQLNKIAKVNGTKLPTDVSIILHNVAIKPEKTYGIYSLYSNWRLAKNTTLLMLCWVCTLISYNTIILNSSSLSGNPFLNFFLQSIAEFPSYMLGKILCEIIGRRFSGALSYLITVVSVAICTVIASDTSLGWFQVTLTVIAKFSISMTYFVFALQSLEIYPTCVRQTGFTFGLISGSIMSTFVPYIVYLGVNYDVKIPYLVITLLSIVGLTAQILLPETLNHKLPETLQEARTFGADQDYWTIPRKNKDTYILANMKSMDHVRNDASDAEN